MADNVPISFQKDHEESLPQNDYIFRVFENPKTDYSIVREYYERQESKFPLDRNSKEFVFSWPQTSGPIFSKVSDIQLNINLSLEKFKVKENKYSGANLADRIAPQSGIGSAIFQSANIKLNSTSITATNQDIGIESYIVNRLTVSENQCLTVGEIEGNLRDFVSPDIMTPKSNENFDKRVKLFSSEDGKPTKIVPLTLELYSPLQQFNSMLPPGVQLDISLRKQDDYKLLTSPIKHDAAETRFIITITGQI